MGASDAEDRDPQGTHREGSPGGRSSRGPNADPGGRIEPGGLIPPYEGRVTERGQDEAAAARAASVERQLAGVNRGGAGQTTTPSQEGPAVESQVGAGEPESPQGVGPSPNRSGESVKGEDGKEPGRQDTGSGAAQRPTGTSTPRDVTGINPG